MKELTVERARKVPVPPERAWSLVSSPALWLLAPGSFAFDLAPTADGRRLRLSISTRDQQVKAGLSELTEEPSGLAVSERMLTRAPGKDSGLFIQSVTPGKRGSTVVLGRRGRVSRSLRSQARTRWGRHLDGLLDEYQDVLEGRRPWPGNEIPPVVRAECCWRRLLSEPASVSASTVIDAPPAEVWQTVWDPATSLRIGGNCLAAGRVPGTPVQQIGEMQYSVVQDAAGSLRSELMVVHECVQGQRALFQTLPQETEMRCLFEPVTEGTQVTFTWSWSGRRPADMTEARRRLAEHAGRYKSLIEEPG